MTTKDFTPLMSSGTAARHPEILESLKLDLKISADGFPAFRKADPQDICIALQSSPSAKIKGIRELYKSACAVYAHQLFFRNIVTSDRYPSLPDGSVAKILSESFGSTGNFFYLIRTLASGTRDPGFLWLYRKHRPKRGSLFGIARLPLYEIPDLSRTTPLLCIDLWEHSYMEDWGSDISGFADAYLRQTDWKNVFSGTLETPPGHPETGKNAFGG